MALTKNEFSDIKSFHSDLILVESRIRSIVEQLKSISKKCNTNSGEQEDVTALTLRIPSLEADLKKFEPRISNLLLMLERRVKEK